MNSNAGPCLILIQGPTGAGKTSVAVALARHYGIPVISADSRQVYREMTIGTAVPSPEELAQARHYFVHQKSVHETFTAGDFAAEALELLEKELFTKYEKVIVAGGSGLYVDALVNGFDDLPQTDPVLRDELSNTPMQALLEELKTADPVYYDQVDRSNPQRVVRALEVYRLTGRPYSALRTGVTADRPFRTLKIGITDPDRQALYEKINNRVDQMVRDGLIEEARALCPLKNLPALQTVGYQELFDYFDGKTTLEKAIELIKRNSRRYAKRQLTWLRRDPLVEWFSADQTTALIEYIDGHL